MNTSGKPELFTVKEAAEFLSLSRKSIDTLIRLQELRAVNMATNPKAARAVWRVTRADLENFIRDRKTKPHIRAA
jgi:excisionase family DNA binding protein